MLPNGLPLFPDLRFTILHIMPPLPPTFWDDGHILYPEERDVRRKVVDDWYSGRAPQVDKFLSEARSALINQGVPPGSIHLESRHAREGIARDLLRDVSKHEYQIVVIGKKSFHERKLFLMGSNANKILQNIKGAVLCILSSCCT